MSTHHLTPAAFTLLAELHRQLDGQERASDEVRTAVAVLTAAADPARAQRLRPGAGEAAVLVARLASWALHRVGDDVIGAAASVLDLRTPAASHVADRHVETVVQMASSGRPVAAAVC